LRLKEILVDTQTGRRRLEYKAWTKKEDATITDLWKTRSLNECSAIMGRGTSSIYNRVQKLQLKRTDEYKAITGCGRFKVGQNSWNAGMKGWDAGGRSKETQFKLGERPSNTWRPVGSERVSKDEILFRKVADTGVKRKDWKAVHALIWEEHNGPIPDRYIVIFKDRDRTNFDPSNLEAVSRQTNMRRNSIARYGEDYRSSAIKLGWFKRKINQMERDNADPQ